jgi:hypothetical protein
MADFLKSAARGFLKLLSAVTLLLAGLLSWWGGRAIHEIWGVDRLLAELVGLAIAAAFGAIGYIAKNASEDDDSTSA